MPYDRDLAPVGTDLGGVIAYLDRELSKLEQHIRVMEEYIIVNRNLHIINGVQSTYLWTDGTALTDPGAGNIGGDANQLSGITVLRFSHTDVFGRDFDELLERVNSSRLDTGDVLAVFDTERAATATYTITSPGVNQGTWTSVAVSYNAGGTTNPQNQDVINLLWKPNLPNGEAFR